MPIGVYLAHVCSSPNAYRTYRKVQKNTKYEHRSARSQAMLRDKSIENTHRSRCTSAGARHGVGCVIGVAGLVAWRYGYEDEKMYLFWRNLVT